MSHYKAIREAFLEEAAKYRQEADIAATITLRTVSLLIADVMEKAAKEWRQRESEAALTGFEDTISEIMQLVDTIAPTTNEEITDEIPTGAHRAEAGETDANRS